YTFLLQNTENEKHQFYFEVIPPAGMEGKITIERPSKPFSVVPGRKQQEIVVLQTKEMLVDNDRKDTVIPIKIRAYALGHEDRIVVYRDAIFTFPRADIYRAQASK
ncbi:MAG: FixG Ig-like domain-containing protein, partial [Sulfurimonadaceae bacterium]